MTIFFYFPFCFENSSGVLNSVNFKLQLINFEGLIKETLFMIVN